MAASLSAGVDVGGTFTDVVVVGNGAPRVVKVPTTPADQGQGLVDGLEAASAAQAPTIAHGTTTATNAVLERDIARSVLVTTRGFGDLLTIGRQNRPSLYDLSVVRPEPLVPAELVVVVAERVAADGSVVEALTDDEVARVVDAVEALGAESVAVCLLFSYANPDHEVRVCEALSSRLGVPVTRSSDLLPEFREYERASTCVLDAAVAPVMRRYLHGLRDRLPAADVSVMTSGGGVADIDTVAAAPVTTLLSGPAAGVVAAAAAASAAGLPNAVAFDMGGTSTDVCLIRDGRPDVAASGEIGGLPFRTPAVAVHTVGAGGGSVADLDVGGALRVGPRSAGAVPGPAAYGRGGTEPTVTDAHVVLGHLTSGRSLGADGTLTLDAEAARRALSRLPGFDTPEAAAEGVLTVARATMARALRRVSTERGVDPAGLALVAYGGAGPLSATALAREIGCPAVVVPPTPGVLSALGLLLAPPRAEASLTVMARWDRTGAPPDLAQGWAAVEAAAARRLPGAPSRRVADCRYAGQSHELRIDVPPGDDVVATAGRLDEAHERAYGYSLPDEPVEVVTLRAVAESRAVLGSPPPEWDFGPPVADGSVEVVLAGTRQEARLVHRARLRRGDEVAGPAVIEQPDTTTLLELGDRATVDEAGNLIVAVGPLTSG